MKNHIESARDWSEDFPHGNGMYKNPCYSCKKTFIGHRRREICKLCYNPVEVKIKSDNDKMETLIQKLMDVAEEIETLRQGMRGNLSSV